MSNPFTVGEAINLARTIAGREGISLREDKECSSPYMRGNTIYIPTMTIYNHREVMEDIHSAIGYAAQENSFFQRLTSENKKQELHKSIIQQMHCDRFLNGQYEGRDEQIANGYSRKAPSIEKALPRIAAEDATSAALLYIGNRARGKWQRWNSMDMPDAIQKEVERLDKLGLEEQWLSLETEDDLRNMLKMIEEDQYAEGKGEGEGEPESGDAKGEGKGDSGGQEGEGSEGADSDSADGSGEGKGKGGKDGKGKGGESENGSKGDGDSKESGVGYSEQFLKNIGCVMDGKENPAHVQRRVADAPPYTPGAGKMIITDTTKTTSWEPGGYGPCKFNTDIYLPSQKMLNGFNLSRKVQKYLLAMAQTRTQLGLRQGLLVPSKITKLYANQSHQQPTMFKRKQASKLETDIAISILVDHSGSMRSYDKYTYASAVGTAMSEVLQSIHIPHEILTFTTKNGADLQHGILRKFNEVNVSRDNLLKRFSASELVFGSNADGEALTWAMERLYTRPERDKLLIVCSDGEPAYGYARGSDEAYLRDVCRLIEKQRGADVLGIGIRTDCVKEYYSRYVVIRDLAELEGAFLELIKSKVLK